MLLNNSPKEYHKKKILQVVPNLVSGGVERGTIEVAKALELRGYKSLIISSGGSLVSQLVEYGIHHIELNVASKNPIIMIRNINSIKEIIKEHNVDIVHARSRAPAWSCYFATKDTRSNFITTFHGVYNISNFIKRHYNKIMTQGQKVIAVSNFVKQHIIDNYNAPENNIVVIHRGVDYEYFNPDNIDEIEIKKFRDKYNLSGTLPVLLMPARMTAWKGHMSLIAALNKLRHLDFHCLMVGDLSKHPAYVKRIKSYIMELKLQSKIQIFGSEMDMRGLYAISDIVLLTSTSPEAFGRTIIEGQAMKKIVIANNIGGAAETIVNESTGYHVKPHDIDDLATTIEHCLSILNTSHAQETRNRARNSAINNFSLTQMLDKTMDVYNTI